MESMQGQICVLGHNSSDELPCILVVCFIVPSRGAVGDSTSAPSAPAAQTEVQQPVPEPQFCACIFLGG